MRVRDLLTSSVYDNRSTLAERMSEVDSELDFAHPAHDWLRMNMVTTLTGSLHDAGKVSDGLSNTTDRLLMGILSRDVDAVLVGAKTVKEEHFGLPDHALLAVLSGHGTVNIDPAGSSLQPSSNSGLIVVTPPAVDMSTNVEAAQHVVLNQQELDELGPATAAVLALRRNGLHRILCEGGASVATNLLEQGMIDELCLTIALTTGGEGHWSSPDVTHQWTPSSILLDEEYGALYLRFTRPPNVRATTE